MSVKPLNKVTQSWGYMRDKFFHKFWDPTAAPDLTQEDSIQGLIVIVTGSNTGIGRETALQLAKRGAKVILACRNLEKAEEAKVYIKANVPNADLVVMQLDLGDLSSIRTFVQEFQAKYNKLDILVNNAGALLTDGKMHNTKDGFEYHIGINHLGPFLLTRLLLPSLKKGESSKIVCVSSSQITLSPLVLDDLMMEKEIRRGLDGLEPYNASKLANSLCIRILAKKLEQEKIQVYQLCPGFVTSEVFRDDAGFSAFMRKFMLKVAGFGPEYGCETSVYCAVNKTLHSDPNFGKGEMHRFCKFYEEGTKFLDPEDPQAIKLYQMSEDLVGLSKE